MRSRIEDLAARTLNDVANIPLAIAPDGVVVAVVVVVVEDAGAVDDDEDEAFFSSAAHLANAFLTRSSTTGSFNESLIFCLTSGFSTQFTGLFSGL